MSDLPRLLFCCFDVVPGPSAISRRLTEYAKGLSERFQVVVLSVKTPDHAHIERYHGARLLRVPVGSGDLAARAQAFDRAVRRQLESEEYLVVHFFDPFGGYALAERRQELGYKLVYDACSFPSVESDPAEPEGGRKLLARVRRQELFCLMNADAIIVGNPLTADWVATLGVERERVFLLLAPVDLGSYAAETMGQPDATPMRVVHLGSLAAAHGLRVLLEGVALARERAPLSLTFVGPSRPAERARLEEVVAARGLADLVKFQAPVAHADLHQVLASCDLGALTLEDNERNRVVGSALSRLGEYLAAGRPVLAADLPAARQLVPHEAVVWYQPQDPASLADALVYLATDPARRVQMGSAARTAAARWDALLVRADLVALYATLAGKSVPRVDEDSEPVDANEVTQLGRSLVAAESGEVTQMGARTGDGAARKSGSGTNKVKFVDDAGPNKIGTEPAAARPDSPSSEAAFVDGPAGMGLPGREDAPVMAEGALPPLPRPDFTPEAPPAQPGRSAVAPVVTETFEVPVTADGSFTMGNELPIARATIGGPLGQAPQAEALMSTEPPIVRGVELPPTPLGLEAPQPPAAEPRVVDEPASVVAGASLNPSGVGHLLPGSGLDHLTSSQPPADVSSQLASLAAAAPAGQAANDAAVGSLVGPSGSVQNAPVHPWGEVPAAVPFVEVALPAEGQAQAAATVQLPDAVVTAAEQTTVTVPPIIPRAEPADAADAPSLKAAPDQPAAPLQRPASEAASASHLPNVKPAFVATQPPHDVPQSAAPALASAGQASDEWPAGRPTRAQHGVEANLNPFDAAQPDAAVALGQPLAEEDWPAGPPQTAERTFGAIRHSSAAPQPEAFLAPSGPSATNDWPAGTPQPAEPTLGATRYSPADALVPQSLALPGDGWPADPPSTRQSLGVSKPDEPGVDGPAGRPKRLNHVATLGLPPPAVAPTQHPRRGSETPASPGPDAPRSPSAADLKGHEQPTALNDLRFASLATPLPHHPDELLSPLVLLESSLAPRASAARAGLWSGAGERGPSPPPEPEAQTTAPGAAPAQASFEPPLPYFAPLPDPTLGPQRAAPEAGTIALLSLPEPLSFDTPRASLPRPAPRPPLGGPPHPVVAAAPPPLPGPSGPIASSSAATRPPITAPAVTAPAVTAPSTVPPVTAPEPISPVIQEVRAPPEPEDEVPEISDHEVEEVAELVGEDEAVMAPDDSVEAVETDASPPDSAIDPWQAQLVHGYCPPGSHLFDRPVPPTTMPGRDS